MKNLSFYVIIAILVTISSCTRLANRIAYGPDGNHKSNASVSQGTVKQPIRQTQQTEWVTVSTVKPEELKDTVALLKQQIEGYKNQIINLNNQLESTELKTKSDVDYILHINKTKDQDLSIARKEISALKAQVDTLRDDLLRTDSALQKALATNTKRNRVVNLGSRIVVGNEDPQSTYSSDAPKIKRELKRKYISYSNYYIRGPRGGCYYLTASGRKQYVDRSLCN